EAQARKLVVFDLGWHFLATLGLYELVYRIGGRRRRNALALVAAVAYAIAGAWGFAAVRAPLQRPGALEQPFEQFAFQTLGDAFGGDKPSSEAIQDLVRTLGARGLVWWFERPSLWDDWLIDQLRAHGAGAWRWPAGSDGGLASRGTTYIVVENDRLHDTMAPL